MPPAHKRGQQEPASGVLKSSAEGGGLSAQRFEGQVVGVAGVVGAVEGEEEVGQEGVDCACDCEGEEEGLGGRLVGVEIGRWGGLGYFEDGPEGHDSGLWARVVLRVAVVCCALELGRC